MCVWYEPRTGRVARNAWHVDSWIRIDGSSRARMNRMRSSGNAQRAVARVYTYLDGGIACPCFRWIRKKGMKGTFGCVSGDLMCNGLYAFFILPAVKSEKVYIRSRDNARSIRNFNRSIRVFFFSLVYFEWNSEFTNLLFRKETIQQLCS